MREPLEAVDEGEGGGHCGGKRLAGLQGVLEYIRDLQPALREWAGAAGAEPQVLVLGSRVDSFLNSSRSGFYSDITGVETFAGLFAYHQCPRILPMSMRNGWTCRGFPVSWWWAR